MQPMEVDITEEYITPTATIKDVEIEQSFLQVSGSGTLPGGAGDGGEF